LVYPNRDLAVAVSQYGAGFIERHEPFDVTCIGSIYEKFLKVIWFRRRFMH
jgi:hypothetical protein